jgi:hypothetical protein
MLLLITVTCMAVSIVLFQHETCKYIRICKLFYNRIYPCLHHLHFILTFPVLFYTSYSTLVSPFLCSATTFLSLQRNPFQPLNCPNIFEQPTNNFTLLYLVYVSWADYSMYPSSFIICQ